MPFTDWDPVVRACVFGAAFLVPLLAILWVWYDTSGRTGAGRWFWRVILSAMVLLTLPAVVLAAANLDVSQRDLMRILGLLAIGSGAVGLLGVVAYAIWGRAPVPAVAPAAPAVAPAAPAEVPTLPSPPTVVMPDPAQGAASVGAYLFVKSGPDRGRQFPVGDQVAIGRADSCTVILADPKVSTEHAQLKREGGSYVFLDLKSTNGSFMLIEGREERLRSSQALVDGDQLRLGATVLHFIRTPTGVTR
jgi:hypothetical protein